MISRQPFRRWHNYLFGVASECLAPALRAYARARVKGKRTEPSLWRRGLILGHTRIGDVLYRTASLEALQRATPRCEWHYLAAPDSAEVLRFNPFLQDILPLGGTTHSLRLAPESLAELRARRFDVALCSNSESYWLDLKVALGARIPNRVGFVHRGLSGFVTHPVTCRYPQPWAGYFRDLVACVGGCRPDWPLTPRVFPSAEDRRAADEQFAAIDRGSGRPVLACFLTSRERSFLWPQSHCAETLRRIAQERPVRIVLAGAASDREVLTEFARSNGIAAAVLAGTLNLRALYSFLQRCAVALAPDSGPRHIANAAGLPVVYIRNLYCSRIETGNYCPNEIDISPDVDRVDLKHQKEFLLEVTPEKAAQALRQAFDSLGSVRLARPAARESHR